MHHDGVYVKQKANPEKHAVLAHRSGSVEEYRRIGTSKKWTHGKPWSSAHEALQVCGQKCSGDAFSQAKNPLSIIKCHRRKCRYTHKAVKLAVVRLLYCRVGPSAREILWKWVRVNIPSGPERRDRRRNGEAEADILSDPEHAC